jgi:hypothetical protein
MGDTPSATHAAAWAARSGELAGWTMARLVNRTDVWGGYYRKGDKVARCTRPAVRLRGQVTLTPEHLARHFRGESTDDVAGTHSTSPANTSRWFAVEIDYHGPTSTAPEVNWGAALGWYGKLREMSFRPLLTDSNGKGGYHLETLLREAAPTRRVFDFVRWLTADYKARGLPQRPECFPKQAAVTETNPCGNWLRLPGRHHTNPDHWSRVWDGSGWLEGDPAIDFILGLTGDDPILLLTHRIRAYLRTLDNRGAGEGRDDIGYTFAAWLLRDMQLPDAEARPWLREWDGGNRPPKGEAEIEKWIRDAHQYGQRPYGSGLDGRPLSNGSGSANGEAATGAGRSCPAADSDTAAGIILAFWRDSLDLVFRRGSLVYSGREGRELRRSDLLAGADFPLIDKLAGATNALRDRQGHVDREAIPRLFRTWAPTAWMALMRLLPEETKQPEVVPMARDEFLTKLTTGLCTRRTLERTVDGKEKQENRSLLSWALLFAPANGGTWRPVRDLFLWSKVEGGVAQVAVRLEVFASTGYHGLENLTYEEFADLCELYQAGERDKVQRGGKRAVRLSQEFLDTMKDTPAGDANE